MSGKTVIVDYGMGNLNSVSQKLKKINEEAIISSDWKVIEKANKLIFPGVGHFGKAMFNLQEANLVAVLNEVVLIKKVPILGICLGMQLMTNYSEEGGVKGLAWFDAEVNKFNISDKLLYKVPHTGWNKLEIVKENLLLKGIDDSDEFYFVHAYHINKSNETDILTYTMYEEPFVSSLQRDNIFGVQFHPEKSHDAGNRLLKNFIEL